MSQYTLPADGTSNSAGAITITFPPVAVNSIASGTVSVPGAPQGAVWNVLVNGQSQGQMVGSTPFGTLQIENSDTLSLTATGVLPSTQYQAVFIGAIDYGTVPSAIPTPQATAILTSSAPDVLYDSTVNLPASGTVTIQNIAMPAPYQSIMVVLNNPGNTSIMQAINQSNGGYFGENAPVAGGFAYLSSFGSTFIFPMVNEPGDNLELKIVSEAGALTNVPIIVFGVRAPLSVLVEAGSGNGLAVNTAVGQNLDVLPLGGATHASAEVTGGSTTLLAAPAAGMQYRLHRAVWRVGTAGDEFILFDGGGNVYSVYTPTTTVPSLNDNLDGLLVSSEVNYEASAGSAYVYLAYDLVNAQTIG